VHNVTLKHPNSRKTHQPMRVVAKGRRARLSMRNDAEGLARVSAEVSARAEEEPTPAEVNVPPGAYIGFLFVLSDQFGGQHLVFIWLPIDEVDPQVSDGAVDID
jgi:hypothetical protein